MEHVTPLWQPNEQECLSAILEHLIDEGVLATRQKFGLPGTLALDEGFNTNLGVDCALLLSLPEALRMLADFLPFFWLMEQTSWKCLPMAGGDGAAAPVLQATLKEIPLRWTDAGTLLLVDVMTPQAADVIRAQGDRLARVITLLGPSVGYACSAWGLRRDQYKALVCRDTLEVVDPHVRWNMIYGSRML